MAQFPDNYEDDLKNRSIPREVAVEDLEPEEIEHITQTVFAGSEFLTADLLFIFGTSSIDNEILESVAREYLRIIEYTRRGDIACL